MAITRRWQSGFEGVGQEHDGGIHNVAGANPKTGTYSNSINSDNNNDFFYKNIPNTRQIRAAHSVYMASIGVGAEGETMTVRAGATKLVTIKIVPATDDVRLLVGGVSKDVTTNSPVSATTHLHFAVDCKIDNAAGWATVYLNGAEILSFAGDTGDSDIDNVCFGVFTDMSGGFWRYDDCYIDDTAGEGAAAVCPLLRFFWIYPNATGNYDQWVGSDGNNTDNYALVDERPPVTADYVEEDTVDQFDSYAMTTYALGAGEQIDAVIPMAYAQRYGADEELAIGTRYDGTDVIGSDQDPGFGDWSYTSERQTAKPGGGAWTQAALDGVEVVLKSRGSF